MSTYLYNTNKCKLVFVQTDSFTVAKTKFNYLTTKLTTSINNSFEWIAKRTRKLSLTDGRPANVLISVHESTILNRKINKQNEMNKARSLIYYEQSVKSAGGCRRWRGAVAELRTLQEELDKTLLWVVNPSNRFLCSTLTYI